MSEQIQIYTGRITDITLCSKATTHQRKLIVVRSVIGTATLGNPWLKGVAEDPSQESVGRGRGKKGHPREASSDGEGGRATHTHRRRNCCPSLGGRGAVGPCWESTCLALAGSSAMGTSPSATTSRENSSAPTTRYARASTETQTANRSLSAVTGDDFIRRSKTAPGAGIING